MAFFGKYVRGGKLGECTTTGHGGMYFDYFTFCNVTQCTQFLLFIVFRCDHYVPAVCFVQSFIMFCHNICLEKNACLQRMSNKLPVKNEQLLGIPYFLEYSPCLESNPVSN